MVVLLVPSVPPYCFLYLWVTLCLTSESILTISQYVWKYRSTHNMWLDLTIYLKHILGGQTSLTILANNFFLVWINLEMLSLFPSLKGFPHVLCLWLSKMLSSSFYESDSWIAKQFLSSWCCFSFELVLVIYLLSFDLSRLFLFIFFLFVKQIFSSVPLCLLELEGMRGSSQSASSHSLVTGQFCIMK